MTSQSKLATTIILLTIASACSHETTKTKSVTTTTPAVQPVQASTDARPTNGDLNNQNQTASHDNIVTTLKFEQDGTTLTPEAKADLDKAVSEARARGEIDDVTVAVWSDMAYPANHKLPSHQVRLADQRGDQIEDYLAKDLNVSSYRVGVHNMGEKPGFLSDFMKNADPALKDQLEAQGVSAADTTDHASSALVFIKLK